MKQRSSKRAKQERSYASSHSDFLSRHPICPVNGERTTQVHHSAKREGNWLLLQRYWIAVSLEGHNWIEANKREAETYGLMVRIAVPYRVHIEELQAHSESLSDPVFYTLHSKLPLVNENNQPIYV